MQPVLNPILTGVLLGGLAGLLGGFLLGREHIVVEVTVTAPPPTVIERTVRVTLPASQGLPLGTAATPSPVVMAGEAQTSGPPASALASVPAQPPGIRLAEPPGLPERLREPALRRAFQHAIVDAAVTGQLLSVDCHEFPCVIYGRVTEDDDLESLLEAEALEGYAGDRRTIVQFVGRSADGTEEGFLRHRFAVALLPAGLSAEQRAQAEQGVDARARAWWNSGADQN